jgi:hypothetical protein
VHTTPIKKSRLSLAAIVACFGFSFANGISNNLIRDHQSPAWWLPVSIIAAAALVYWFWRGERDFMRSEDELQQKIRVEALARSFPCAIAVVLFQEKLRAGGYDLPAGWSELGWLLPMLPYFPILAWCKRRYQ